MTQPSHLHHDSQKCWMVAGQRRRPASLAPGKAAPGLPRGSGKGITDTARLQSREGLAQPSNLRALQQKPTHSQGARSAGPCNDNQRTTTHEPAMWAFRLTERESGPCSGVSSRVQAAPANKPVGMTSLRSGNHRNLRPHTFVLPLSASQDAEEAASHFRDMLTSRFVFGLFLGVLAGTAILGLIWHRIEQTRWWHNTRQALAEKRASIDMQWEVEMLRRHEHWIDTLHPWAWPEFRCNYCSHKTPQVKGIEGTRCNRCMDQYPPPEVQQQ